MGKRGKKLSERQKPRCFPLAGDDEDDDVLPSSAYDLPSPPTRDQEGGEEEKTEEVEDEEEQNGDGEGRAEEWASSGPPSKFHLYQRSVQSPKGDISYMQKFFLMYVGGRFPLHLQEDFCGTALLSSEWLHSDPRRTAVGLDLDLEALNWCLENNLNKVGADGYSRISLFHGNVLQPHKACLVKHRAEDLMKGLVVRDEDYSIQMCSSSSTMEEAVLPSRDIICAFNYSCCCLHKRTDLVLYFKHAFHALSKKGGIFVMDLYGGRSSECKLRLQRRFSDFTYVWEQAEFDIINRRTRISLHFHLGKKQMLRHAFAYDWRLWSLPEIKDCLEEAGFQYVRFWMRQMPNTDDRENLEEFTVGRDVKYEELSSFQQQDAWNTYIVGVKNN
ncbi:uncharacterized protein [Elaeis guineensis]|uniref:Uncharacterized protein LOC105061382 n=1 Tax=Elaeis guineensis var. tenera TaxID=51953 RepID=A0A6I9SI56_ELAGV|nr:uncharacterized protein LOC105061382 [Elaeis guineensis]